MGIHDYRFVTRWLVAGTPREVRDVLGDPMDLPRWWPAVYRRAEQIQAGDADGIGRTVRLRTRGWLPYRLDWTLRLTEPREHGFAFEADGDFAGVGEWTFEPEGAFVEATFDWRIEARKPLLRFLAPVFRPALEANHRWAMRRGEESLRLELERRRAASEWEREQIPAPPGPATGRVGCSPARAGPGPAAAGETARRRRARRRSGSGDDRLSLDVQLRMLVDVALAMFFGAFIGLERELRRKAAGLRTHMLVAGAAAMLVEGARALEHSFSVPLRRSCASTRCR